MSALSASETFKYQKKKQLTNVLHPLAGSTTFRKSLHPNETEKLESEVSLAFQKRTYLREFLVKRNRGNLLRIRVKVSTG